MNFLNFGKRTLKVLLYSLRAFLPQKLRTSAEVLSEAHFAPDSIAESAGYGVLSSGEKNSSVRCQYMNFLRPRKRTSETALYAMEAGRSMIEMLGVLAIIGVLSVGAIAGYQKAMFKYKLNKHAEAFNLLLNNSIQLHRQLSYSNSDDATYYSNLLQKLNLLPDGINYVNNVYLRDIFKNMMWVYKYDNQKFGGIGINFEASNEGQRICQNIVQTAKENSQDLWVVQTYKHYNDSSPTTTEGGIAGDSYCSVAANNCLRDLTLQKISALCNVCDEQQCTLYVLWR